MTLLATRTLFVDLSGRADLVVNLSAYADNGADFFIKAGQKHLDRLFEHEKAWGRYFEKLAAGVYYSTFENCRSLQKVWVNNSTDRWEIEKKDLDWLETEYDDPISDITQGGALYWAPALLRQIGSQDRTELETFGNYILASSDAKKGVIIMPPPDEEIILEVWGHWYSDVLSVDGSTSWWTENAENTLVKAALRELEIFYRNSEGVKDWDAAIAQDIAEFDMDGVSEVIANVDRMRG